MAAYTFKQLPPGKLLIQLLEKKFTGLLVVRPSGSVISIGFFEGRPVSYEIAGADMNIESLREAMLLLFVDSAHSFEMQSSAVAPEKGHSPLSIIREGVLTHYTKERLIGEARELLKGKLTFVEGYDAYLPLYQFEPNELSVINELSETPSTARELAERTSVPLHRVIGVLYVLALTRLITLYSEAVIIEQPQEDLSDEARALLEELKAALAAMESDNIFERFGVSPSVTTEEVEKKFREKARKFHPDVLQHKGLSAHRALAASYFEKLTEVYNVLHDPKERERLKVAPVSKEDQEDVRKILEAEMSYQKALIHFRRKEYSEAEEYMKTAVQNAPDDGSYLGLWAWITYINPASNKDAIRDSIKRALIEAVELAKREATLHFYLGRVLVDGGQTGSAIQHFKRALAINPEYIEASRELRMIERNKTKENSLMSKTGAFLNIFKKK